MLRLVFPPYQHFWLRAWLWVSLPANKLSMQELNQFNGIKLLTSGLPEILVLSPNFQTELFKQFRWVALKYFFGFHIKSLIDLKTFGATFEIGGIVPIDPLRLRAWARFTFLRSQHQTPYSNLKSIAYKDLHLKASLKINIFCNETPRILFWKELEIQRRKLFEYAVTAYCKVIRKRRDMRCTVVFCEEAFIKIRQKFHNNPHDHTQFLQFWGPLTNSNEDFKREYFQKEFFLFISYRTNDIVRLVLLGR